MSNDGTHSPIASFASKWTRRQSNYCDTLTLDPMNEHIPNWMNYVLNISAVFTDAFIYVRNFGRELVAELFCLFGLKHGRPDRFRTCGNLRCQFNKHAAGPAKYLPHFKFNTHRRVCPGKFNLNFKKIENKQKCRLCKRVLFLGRSNSTNVDNCICRW